MSTDTKATEPSTSRELVITRLIAAPREKLFAAWTDPKLLTQWFTPPPWMTPHAELDVRPGGSSLVIMRGPDGTEMPHRGVYLEVVKNERLVFTDAYMRAWEPSEKPFMTVVLTFEAEGGQTRYTARVLHWTVADREAHEKMGPRRLGHRDRSACGTGAENLTRLRDVRAPFFQCPILEHGITIDVRAMVNECSIAKRLSEEAALAST